MKRLLLALAAYALLINLITIGVFRAALEQDNNQ